MKISEVLRGLFQGVGQKPKRRHGPLLLKVRIIEHAYRCGYIHSRDGEDFITVVEPVNEDDLKLYGRFDVYSRMIWGDYPIGAEVTLPFVENPYYRPGYGDEPMLLLYVDKNM